jgi:hypothetical protein
MDDLQLAVETILLNRVRTGATVTLEASVDGATLALAIGPLDRATLDGTAGPQGRVDTDHLLRALTEHVGVEERATEPWLRIEKLIPNRHR